MTRGCVSVFLLRETPQAHLARCPVESVPVATGFVLGVGTATQWSRYAVEWLRSGMATQWQLNRSVAIDPGIGIETGQWRSKILPKRLLLARGVAIPLSERMLRAMKNGRIERCRDGKQGACLGVDCALVTLRSLPPSFVSRFGAPHARH